MKLNRPPANSGGFTDSFRLEAGKSNIRIFPFVGDDGEHHLATKIVIHFEGGNGAPVPCLGQGCPMCAEAAKTGNNRMKATTRFPMVVVPEGEELPKRFDCPASLYDKINTLLDDFEEDELDDVLGNNGQDFTVTYNKGSKNPSKVYEAILRRKGSVVLDIDDSTIPNLIKECTNEANRKMVSSNAGGEEAVKDEDTDVVVFLDASGEECEGTWTGKMQGDKYVIESEGHLRKIPACRIVSGIEVDTDDAPPVEEAEEEPVKPVKSSKPAKKAKKEEPKFTEGDAVTVDDPDEGEVEATVVSYDEDAGTVTVENDDYDPWTVPEDKVTLA